LPQVTIEYMIMVPVLILQIFLFPIAASVIMNTWVDSRMTIELQETAGHLGSSIQQLYYTMNHASISSGSLTAKLDTPPTIEGHYYNITLQDATNSNTTSLRIMNVTLSLAGTNDKTSTLVTLGENADWQNNAIFLSNSTTSIIATKSSGSIWLSFEGGT
jgi:hypothetical protein